MDDWQYKPATDFGLPPAERMRSLHRESGLAGTLMQGAAWWLTRASMAVMHRLRIEGKEHLPSEPPFILAANHCSHLDTAAMAMAVPRKHRSRIFPIAAGDTFFNTPAKSLLAATILNALPMWRHNCGRHALADMRNRLQEDRCIYILFPEGTRSRTGKMAPFKPGVGMLLAGTNAPVVPCQLIGTFKALPPKRALPRPHSITLRIGPPLSFADTPNKRQGWEDAASTLEQAIRKLAVPTEIDLESR